MVKPRFGRVERQIGASEEPTCASSFTGTQECKGDKIKSDEAWVKNV
jgi:hypothetical protein